MTDIQEFAIFYFLLPDLICFLFYQQSEAKDGVMSKIVKKIANVTYFSRFTNIELNLIFTCILSLNSISSAKLVGILQQL